MKPTVTHPSLSAGLWTKLSHLPWTVPRRSARGWTTLTPVSPRLKRTARSSAPTRETSRPPPTLHHRIWTTFGGCSATCPPRCTRSRATLPACGPHRRRTASKSTTRAATSPSSSPTLRSATLCCSPTYLTACRLRLNFLPQEANTMIMQVRADVSDLIVEWQQRTDQVNGVVEALASMQGGLRDASDDIGDMRVLLQGVPP
mmetsp:Transcript_54272/g.150984  ORF Transcript_54272/g.150984 Transcript_54272/m.150984 type:complete len:202 (+) Transcript_54272:603-1208(+)